MSLTLFFTPEKNYARTISTSKYIQKRVTQPLKYGYIHGNIHGYIQISIYYPDNIQISRYYPWIISGYFMDIWIQHGYKSLRKISRYYPLKISRKYPKYPFFIQILSMDTRVCIHGYTISRICVT